MRIIPAIDIIDGKCVRLSKGDYNTKKVYGEDPLEVAKRFEVHGIRYLHLVDLDGAKSKQIMNQKVLEQLATQTQLEIDFGGGIKSTRDIEIAFNCGARQVTSGSIAVNDPSLFEDWLKLYGKDRIILGADAKDGKIATGGWMEESGMELIPFIQGYLQKGVSYVISTDIAKDGMLEGTAVALYRRIIESCLVDDISEKLNLIASGGVSRIEELALLKEIGCEGAIIGKAIYENKISLQQLENYILNVD